MHLKKRDIGALGQKKSHINSSTVPISIFPTYVTVFLKEVESFHQLQISDIPFK